MGEAEAFDVTTLSLGAGQTVVCVRGELDVATCSELEAALAEAPPEERIVVDLTHCSFMDSAAIRVLLTSASAGTGGGIVSLVSSDPGLLRVLEIADVAARIPIHPTVEAATVG